LELAIEKFLYKQKVMALSSCTVIEFEDPTVLFHTGYVICTKATNQGVNFRNAIKNGYDIIMRDVHPGEEDF